MKITGFCPMIVTKDQDSVIATFEALGFEKRHTKTDIEGGANVGVAMKDTNGKGFIDPRGSKTTVTSSDQATMLIAPSGFPIVISEHFK